MNGFQNFQDLEVVEADYRRILELDLNPWTVGTIREGFVHFILRTLNGVYNFDIDQILQNPVTKATVILSLKDRPHEYDWVYKRMNERFGWKLFQLIFDQDWNEFSILDKDKHFVTQGDRSGLLGWLKGELDLEET